MGIPVITVLSCNFCKTRCSEKPTVPDVLILAGYKISARNMELLLIALQNNLIRPKNLWKHID
jgi:hypothetical protein